MRVVLSVVAGAMILAALPVAAHHSFAAEFDVNRPISITGTVTRVELTNPHAWLHLDVENDEGVAEPWKVEMLGINTLLRRGWTRDTLTPGDVISITGFGSRDGTNTGNASRVTRDNGELLWDSAAR